MIVLDLPVDVALGRVDRRGETRTWCENEGRLTWCRRVFETMAASRDNTYLVDATRSPDEVHAAVWAAVEPALTR